MNINIIKKLYEKLPSFIKMFFLKIFRYSLIKNPIFIKTWKELEEYDRMSIKEQKNYQLLKLKNILIYSYENVEYYRELFDKYYFDPYNIKELTDIEVLPLLEKDDAVKLGNKLLSNDKKLKYYKIYTGGSSGRFLTVFLEKDSIYKEYAFIYYFFSKFGYDIKKTKTVALRAHNHDVDYYLSPMKNEIDISPFLLFKDNSINDIVKKIKDFGATWLVGYPSAIYTFAKIVVKEKIDINFEHIIYYSENYYDDENKFVEKVFGCKADTYYGLSERTCFGEIINNNCEFNKMYGYTELISTEIPDEYRIICTGFFNKKMPLIRYATDDIIKKCNKKNIIIGHRNKEVCLISKNGNPITKLDVNSRVKKLDNVKYYQYVQKEIGKVELHIVPIIHLSKKDIKKIHTYLKKRFEGMLDIEIKIVDSIKLTSKGKYVWAINKINEESVTQK